MFEAGHRAILAKGEIIIVLNADILTNLPLHVHSSLLLIIVLTIKSNA